MAGLPIRAGGATIRGVQSSEFKQQLIKRTLGQSELFGGLPEEDLREVSEFTQVRNLEKGGYLFREGDDSHGFYIVQKGSINLHRVSRAGKEQVMHIFRTGESLGVATLGSACVCPADARAEESSQVLLVQRQEFIALLQRRPELVLRVLGSMCTHCRVMSMQIDDLTLQDVETRLGNWLLKRCPSPDGQAPVDIMLTIPKRVLAAELGTVSETLSRALARYRKQDLLKVNGRTLTVTSPSRLSAFLERHWEEQGS